MILERDAELAQLAALMTTTESCGGHVVLVRGEVGIGKSTLMTRFLQDCGDQADTLLGACDDLLTPQPFGPVWDMARTEPSLSPALSAGDRRAVMEASLDLLSRRSRPTAVVIEDTQWADEATLDLIKFLGRRIARANGLLVLTYRDAEVDDGHPLRQVVADLAPENLVRMSLDRLSRDAVASMMASDPEELDVVMALTRGNPLFVAEVLASAADDVPLSVSDAVLARAAKISTEARQVLDLISVVPGEVEKSLVERIQSPSEEQLAESVRQGLLRVDDDLLLFPHDLQRRAIESGLTPARRRLLNQQVLGALGDSADAARLAHHAAEADNVEAIVEHAPRAARTALGIGSTTEAVAHFRRLEPYLDRLERHEQAKVLREWANAESQLVNPESADLIKRALACHRVAGDEAELARTLIVAGRISQLHGSRVDALAQSSEAVALLDPYGPSADLARALTNCAFLEFFYVDTDVTVLPLVDRALAVATEVEDDDSVAVALSIKAQVIFSRGDLSGMGLMDDSLRRSRRLGDHWGEARALFIIAGMYGDVREVARAIDFAQRASSTAARYEIRVFEATALAICSEFLLWSGDWAAAENMAVEAGGSTAHTEALTSRVLGTIQARRGRNEARSLIWHMWSLLRSGDAPMVADSVAAAMAEYLWLSGDRDPEILERLEEILDEGIALGSPWPSGAFAFWTWKLGLLETAPVGSADFYAWIIDGEYKKAADFWHEKGAPYEEGLALMHGDVAEQTEALRIFDDLGAIAIANKVRRALSDQGATVPRGRSQATRDHVAGLTARQAEVLGLLAEELSNTEIADRLFLSSRTVESHVSAVLMKLDVATRDEAVKAAHAQGILAS